ncbi:MAG: hypothetical protein IPM29_20275 [Planctomycetes bacterium]|nr:hypothetical protein [Planctomycetota bacterium]
MSPIGRVFAVLNVFFAGAFLYHAGVYLERDAHWKTEYTSLKTTTDGRIDDLLRQVTAAEKDKEAKERQLTLSEQQRVAAEQANTALETRNKELDNRLTEMERDLKAVKDDYATVSSSIQEAVRNAQLAMQRSIEAGQARDAAVADKVASEAELRRARDRMAQLQDQIGELTATVAMRDDTIRQKDILLEIVKVKAPGLLVDAVPPLNGTVQRVDADGKLVTILITGNPTGADVLRGYSFAVFSGETGYKGEAMVQEVDGNFAFCRVTRTVQGARITVGDQASTNTYN